MAIQKSTPRRMRRHDPLKRRRDAGSTRLKARDVDILRLGAEQTFVRFDTVGEYLAPGYAPATVEPPATQLADATPSVKRDWPADLRHRFMAVSRLMRKLQAQGYVEIIQPWADQPAWFRVTEQALRLLNLDWPEILFPETYADLEARLRHDRHFTSHNHLINQVRLLLASGGAGMPAHEWKGERSLEVALPPREHGTRRPHKADGICLLKEDGAWHLKSANQSEILATIPMEAGKIIGIEVECSQKSERRLLEILPDLLRYHDFVWYFCKADVQQAVANARKKAFESDAERGRIRILKLEDYLSC